MTEIYLHFLFAHYGLYGNAPVSAPLVSRGSHAAVFGYVLGLDAEAVKRMEFAISWTVHGTSMFAESPSETAGTTLCCGST